MGGKSTYFSPTHILPDAPKFSAEQVHWVDYKEKLDDVLFFHSSTLRDIFQGQARPEKYALIPNDVAVVPAYVAFPRPTVEEKPIPEQWRGNTEEEAQWIEGQEVAREVAKLAGPVTPTAATAGYVIGQADLSLPNSLAIQGRNQAIAGKAEISCFRNPACELSGRQNSRLFRIPYYACNNVEHSLLQQLCPIDECGDCGNGQKGFNITCNRYEGRSEARVRSLLVEMQSCTLQPGEGPDVYFARLYRLRLQLQQVCCTVDDYQLKANALSGLSIEYIPMLNQLHTIQSLALTMVNDMVREVYVNDILPKKAKKGPLRGYRSESATTTTTAKRSGMKRDLSEVFCHSKEQGHYANICRANKPLPGETTTKWCSLQKARSHSDDECMAQQNPPHPATQVSALPATFAPAAETCSFTFASSSSFSSIKKVGLQLLVDSGSSSHLVDSATNPNAEQHLRKFQGASTTASRLWS